MAGVKKRRVSECGGFKAAFTSKLLPTQRFFLFIISEDACGAMAIAAEEETVAADCQSSVM